MPEFSIVIATYNRADYLPEMLDSLFIGCLNDIAFFHNVTCLIESSIKPQKQ